MLSAIVSFSVNWGWRRFATLLIIDMCETGKEFKQAIENHQCITGPGGPDFDVTAARVIASRNAGATGNAALRRLRKAVCLRPGIE
jgi:hypothetical protein